MLGDLCQPTGAGTELFHKFMMNASVEMAKSNRRKQSKPNRLLAEEGNATAPKLSVNYAALEQSASTDSPPLQVCGKKILCHRLTLWRHDSFNAQTLKRWCCKLTPHLERLASHLTKSLNWYFCLVFNSGIYVKFQSIT